MHPDARTTASLLDRALVVRQSRTYDIVSRVIGSTWFLLLALSMALWPGRSTTEPSIPSFETALQLLARVCLVTFYVMLWGAVLTRPRASHRSGRAIPNIIAFIGTYLPWLIPLLAPPRHGPAISVISALCLCCGMIMMVYTMSYLGRCFSIVPQARGVVHTGPYRWIRHPLYFAEAIATIGAVLQFMSPLTLLVFALQLTAQVMRILYEERVLRQAMPEYEAYAVGRWRLLPGIW